MRIHCYPSPHKAPMCMHPSFHSRCSPCTCAFCHSGEKPEGRRKPKLRKRHSMIVHLQPPEGLQQLFRSPSDQVLAALAKVCVVAVCVCPVRVSACMCGCGCAWLCVYVWKVCVCMCGLRVWGGVEVHVVSVRLTWLKSHSAAWCTLFGRRYEAQRVWGLKLSGYGFVALDASMLCTTVGFCQFVFEASFRHARNLQVDEYSCTHARARTHTHTHTHTPTHTHTNHPCFTWDPPSRTHGLAQRLHLRK